MRHAGFLAIALLLTLATGGTAAAQERPSDGPLTVLKQGSFFVGGETQSLPAEGGDITVNQMYVQYQVPTSIEAQPKPAVVLVHGCCLSAKSFEDTPDGRMGWNEYFLRQG
jgi:hypothetical protein